VFAAGRIESRRDTGCDEDTLRAHLERLAGIGIHVNHAGALGGVTDEAGAFLSGVVSVQRRDGAGYHQDDEAQQCHHPHKLSFTPESTHSLKLYVKETRRLPILHLIA
jgi:hypothetical protein